MTVMNCDVLVVGAGPAGASAARACATAGLETIIIDKRSEVGYPVHCAEGMGSYLFPLLPFKIPREQLIWKTEGIEFWAEDVTIRRRGVMWSGYTVNRRVFDKWLVRLAVHAGAKLMLGAELTGLECKHKHVVEKATIKTKTGLIEVRPKIVIGADGFESATLKLLGEYRPRKDAIAEIYSFELKNMDLAAPMYEQIYVGDFTTTGYAYVFPISRTKANVGVGCVDPKKPMEEYYEEFLGIPEVKHQVRHAIPTEDKGGKVNVLPLTKQWDYGNVLVAGDAADQNLKPFAEGILPAIICGDLAGKAAAKHIRKNRPLQEYTHDVKRTIGPLLEQSDEAGKLIYQLYDMKQPKEYLLLMNLIANLNTPQKIREQLEKQDYAQIRDQTLKWQEHQKQIPTQIMEYVWYQYMRASRRLRGFDQ